MHAHVVNEPLASHFVIREENVVTIMHNMLCVAHWVVLHPIVKLNNRAIGTIIKLLSNYLCTSVSCTMATSPPQRH